MKSLKFRGLSVFGDVRNTPLFITPYESVESRRNNLMNSNWRENEKLLRVVAVVTTH